jgi:diguanylate cyclase (GGDEF)-like protein/PAS domain S-box-containing protein
MTMEKMRILIVEDEGLIARDVEDMVRNAGYEVCAVVGTGEEAVDKAEKTQPDLILMDIILRGAMDGVEAAEKIRERFDIPVIYLTAHTDENTLERAKLTEPLGYTLKPVEQKELMTVMEMALYKNEMEIKLKERQSWLTTILESIGEGVIATERGGNITFMNQVAEKMTGWSQSDSIGKPLTSVLHLVDEDTGKLVRVSLPQLLEDSASNPINGNIQIVNFVDKTPIELTFTPIQDGKDNIHGLVLVLHDLTERKRYEEKLRYNAVTDHLTELPNRFLFFDRLNMALAQAQRDFQKLAIIMLDLDEFKKVNDTYGHNIGDQLLRAVANRLVNMFRKGDTIARWGGDEFILLLPEIRQTDVARNVAERILHSFNKPFELDGPKIAITASIGVALFPDDGADADTLIKDADIAMYHAKDSGRNCFHQYTHEQREYSRH